MSYTVEIIIKDSNGVEVTETIITTPNLTEAEDVNDELVALVNTSTLISSYTHVGPRPPRR